MREKYRAISLKNFTGRLWKRCGRVLFAIYVAFCSGCGIGLFFGGYNDQLAYIWHKDDLLFLNKDDKQWEKDFGVLKDAVRKEDKSSLGLPLKKERVLLILFTEDKAYAIHKLNENFPFIAAIYDKNSKKIIMKVTNDAGQN